MIVNRKVYFSWLLGLWELSVFTTAVVAAVADSTAATTTSMGNGLFFFESFDGPDPFKSGKWQKSRNNKFTGQPLLIKPADKAPAGFQTDKGIQLGMDMKNYGFSATFEEPLSLKDGGDIVVQYDLKLQSTLKCGGAYVKLPRVSDGLDLKDLNSSTPYTIMFGPDKCGNDNKIHFIVQYQNPISQEWEEKHFNKTINFPNNKLTHMYTLALHGHNNSFEIYGNKKLIGQGSLLTDMVPAINPPKLIDDVTDKKPANWEDEEYMYDPFASKPDDWDETEPRLIPNMDAVKPSDWREDEPLMIPDPDAIRPVDWDDEEDGEYEPPQVSNPACENVGCGPWKRPSKTNPLYKGIWKAPIVPNPLFKGKWVPRQVPNPHYFEEQNPAQLLAPMAGIAVEVWTTDRGILFDNFLIARSLEDAFKSAETTFDPKRKAELLKDKADSEAIEAADRAQFIAQGGFRARMQVYAVEILDFIEDNLELTYGCIAAVVIMFLSIVIFGGKSASKKLADAAKEVEQEAEAETAAKKNK